MKDDREYVVPINDIEKVWNMDYKEYYECDPNKNTQCNKRICHVDGGCRWTKHKEYARDNTEPFKVKV